MIYVMSDIHGCYDEFQAMLKKINFDPEKDELIINGDIVDRGPQTYEMLKYMESDPKNVTFILGNHDEDFIYYCKGLKQIFYNGLWDNLATVRQCPFFHRYVKDYYDTIQNLTIEQENLKLEEFDEWQHKFSKMPRYIERTVNGKNFIIVHGGYITKENYDRNGYSLYRSYGLENIEQYYVWARYWEQIEFGGKPDTTIIIGHTPTIFNTEGFYNNGYVWQYTRKTDNCRFINIDCGLVYAKNYPNEVKHGTLACFRLDDEKIFYLDD